AVEMLAHRLEARAELVVGEEVDFLLRKVDRRLDVAAQLDHRLGEPAHHGGELPLQRAHGGAQRLARARVDEIGDRFGLRQIQLVIEEGALGEFPGVCAARAERSEEHTSELQSPYDLVCRLLLEKKKQQRNRKPPRHIKQNRVTSTLP